jgi:hypothetical protein
MEPTGSDKNLPMAPTQSQMKAAHTLPSYFFKTHFNIAHPSAPRFSGNLFLQFSDQYFAFSFLPVSANYFTDLIFLDLFILI